MISSALYRFFGMVQISSGGFLPLLIWTSYFRLGQTMKLRKLTVNLDQLMQAGQQQGSVEKDSRTGRRRLTLSAKAEQRPFR
jgi:c-di-GMP-binding flagellar brake protein YcgR